MRKLFYLLVFLGVCLIGKAQKSYVHIMASDITGTFTHSMSMTGDVPADIEDIYMSRYITIGEMLNLFAERGYVLEFMTAPVRSNTIDNTTSNNKFSMCYVLSCDKTPEIPTEIKTVKPAETEEVYEVARYNLQGLPVSEGEKGVQVIVFSNYTTRTVIVE